MAGSRDHDGRQSPVHGPRRPGRHAGRFDCAIEAFVEVPKSLVVQPVARFMDVEQGQNETGFVRLSADPACCLDIFRCGLWLALHQHETEAADVEADGNHVGCKRYVDPVSRIRTGFCQGFLRRSDLVGVFARGQFQHVAQAPVRERLVGRCDPAPLGSVAGKPRAHLVFDDPARAAEFAQRVEVAERREIGIGIAAGLCLSLGCRQQCGQCAKEDQLRPLTGRGEADIQTRRPLR